LASPRIKICGITRVEDAQHCDRCGVDAIGFVFVKKSKRYIDFDAAAAIATTLGPFVNRVGLFLNDEETYVHTALEAMPDLVPQFHGQETPTYCNSFNRPYIKAIGVGSGMPAAEELAAYTGACALLFDSNAAGELGGTGHSFDWAMLTGYTGKPLILAGGLSAANLATAIATVKPYAVDVSSSVESAPGRKDPELVTRFVTNTRTGFGQSSETV